MFHLQAIGFENGNVQLMRGEADEQPIVLKTGLRASRVSFAFYTSFSRPRAHFFVLSMQISWSSSGSVLAVAGEFWETALFAN